MQLFTLCSIKFIFDSNTIALISKLRFAMCVRYSAMMMTELAVSVVPPLASCRVESRDSSSVFDKYLLYLGNIWQQITLRIALIAQTRDILIRGVASSAVFCINKSTESAAFFLIC